MSHKLTDRGSGSLAAPIVCEVKWLLLSMESGGSEESVDLLTLGSVSHWKDLSEGLFLGG